MLALEAAVLSAWYCSRPEIRRLRATKDTQGLRVLVELEPAQDSNETHPTWIANRREWADELQWHTCAIVRLENADDSRGDETGVVIADLSWRDPSSI